MAPILTRFAFSDFAGWGGESNRVFTACVEACRDKNCVFDVGAYIGLGALPMASVLAPGGRVYAFAVDGWADGAPIHIEASIIDHENRGRLLVTAEDIPLAGHITETVMAAHVTQDGLGPGLELEIDAGRMGHMGFSVFIGGQAYRLLGSRDTRFTGSFTDATSTETATFSVEIDPWLVRGGVGLRVRWLP